MKYLSGAENIMGYDVLNEPYPGSEGGKVFRKLVRSGVSTLLKLPTKEKLTRLRQLKDKQENKTLFINGDLTDYDNFTIKHKNFK